MTKDKIYEKDMYPALKDFFETNGYKVNAEVKGCDIVVSKDDYIAVVEMKLHLNITLIYQALDRLDITNNVFIAVKKPKKSFMKERSKMKKLVKKLNIGLILVDLSAIEKTVEVVVEPITSKKDKNTKKTRSVQKEIKGRRFDNNIGGSNKTKIMTSYKDLSIKLACICEQYTVINSKFLKENFDLENTYPVLYNNFFNFFIIYGKGDFGLSDEGIKMLDSEEYKDLVSIYRNDIKKKVEKDIENS